MPRGSVATTSALTLGEGTPPRRAVHGRGWCGRGAARGASPSAAAVRGRSGSLPIPRLWRPAGAESDAQGPECSLAAPASQQCQGALREPKLWHSLGLAGRVTAAGACDGRRRRGAGRECRWGVLTGTVGAGWPGLPGGPRMRYACDSRSAGWGELAVPGSVSVREGALLLQRLLRWEQRCRSRICVSPASVRSRVSRVGAAIQIDMSVATHRSSSIPCGAHLNSLSEFETMRLSPV